MAIAAMFIGVLLVNQIIGIVYKSFSTMSADNDRAVPVFMSLWTGLMGIVMVAAALVLNRSFTPSAVTVVAALAGGLCFAIAGILFIRVLSIGPFIWSALMMNLSNFIPVLFSLIFLGETISFLQTAGVLVILSILFVMSAKSKSGDRPFTARWMVLAVIMMFANGGILSAQKAQTYYMAGAQIIEFLALLALFASFFALAYHFLSGVGKPKQARVQLRPFLLLAMAMAATIGASNMLGMTLMQYVTAAVQFPIVVGGGIVLTAIVGIRLYHEKPTPRLYLSAAMLMIAVVLLGVG